MYHAWNLFPYGIIMISRAIASWANSSILQFLPSKQYATVLTHVDDLTLQSQLGQ